MGRKEKRLAPGIGKPLHYARVDELLRAVAENKDVSELDSQGDVSLGEEFSHETAPYGDWLSQIERVEDIVEEKPLGRNYLGDRFFRAQLVGLSIPDVQVRVHKNAKVASVIRTHYMEMRDRGMAYDAWRLSQRIVFVWSKEAEAFKGHVEDQIEAIHRFWLPRVRR